MEAGFQNPLKHSASVLFACLMAFILTGCGGTHDGASNAWVVHNPETQAPKKTQSVITDSQDTVFAGTQVKNGQATSLLTRYNLQGTAIWEATEIADRGLQAITENNTNFIVAGGTVVVDGFQTNFSAPFIAKYDDQGNQLWSAPMGTFEYTDLNIETDAAGNIYVLTHQWQRIEGSTHVNYNLAKFDDAGASLWHKNFTIQYQSYDPLFDVDSSGNSYLAYTKSAPRLLKFNSSGEQQWEREMPHEGSTVARIRSLMIDNNDQAIVHTGTYKEILAGFIPSDVAATFAYDSNGDIVWEHHLPDPAVDLKLSVRPQGMTVDSEGNYYLTYSSTRQDASIPCPMCAVYSHRVYVTKLSPTGNVVWHTEHKTNGEGTEVAFVGLNDHFIAMADHDTLRTFNLNDGSIVIEQDISQTDHRLSHVLMDSDDHIYLITDAGNAYNSYYSIEKWTRIPKQ